MDKTQIKRITYEYKNGDMERSQDVIIEVESYMASSAMAEAIRSDGFKHNHDVSMAGGLDAKVYIRDRLGNSNSALAPYEILVEIVNVYLIKFIDLSSFLVFAQTNLKIVPSNQIEVNISDMPENFIEILWHISDSMRPA